ncbi:MAG: hypothetical protein JNM42_13545 [Propionivibrio sp.]|uniref:hypothetical protein n=1 Tax=Propionivibrio sp. TaxID=2212460 RepID=UPI001A41BE0D|nr:hypothetical protein [Propionivibrio sp.]MBL8415456.1 hypothetical protein [Propionivibrio sp.]
MTEPRQDLPTDPQVSRLYREHAQAEPSAAIDQDILERARQAVTARPPGTRRTGWWQRWRMPLTLLTTVMLTVTLTLLVERQPGELSTQPGVEQPRSESMQDRVEAQSKKQAEASAPARTMQAPAAPSVKESRPLPSSDSRERDASRASRIATEQAPAAPAAADKAESAAPAAANAANQAAGRVELRAAPEFSAARPAAAPLAKSRADGTRTPELWLEEIRALRSAGKSEEAERQLAEFRRAHPDYRLPEEFRK